MKSGKASLVVNINVVRSTKFRPKIVSLLQIVKVGRYAYSNPAMVVFLSCDLVSELKCQAVNVQ